VLPSSVRIWVGSCTPGNCTRIRSPPSPWRIGSATPTSSMRRRTISTLCSIAPRWLASLPTSVGRNDVEPSGALLTSMSGSDPAKLVTATLVIRPRRTGSAARAFAWVANVTVTPASLMATAVPAIRASRRARLA
jgi:hypothetical protein